MTKFYLLKIKSIKKTRIDEISTDNNFLNRKESDFNELGRDYPDAKITLDNDQNLKHTNKKDQDISIINGDPLNPDIIKKMMDELFEDSDPEIISTEAVSNTHLNINKIDEIISEEIEFLEINAVQAAAFHGEIAQKWTSIIK